MSNDKAGLSWRAATVRKKQYIRNRSVSTDASSEALNNLDSGVKSVNDMDCRVPFRSIADVVLGSLADKIERPSLSSEAVLSILTVTHSLEFELDSSAVSTSSYYVADKTIEKINSAVLSRKTETRNTSASAFTRQSSLFSFGGDIAEPHFNKTVEQLAHCPQTISRHPFLRALRVALQIHGHIRMVKYVQTELSSMGSSYKASITRTDGLKKKVTGKRPFDRAMVRTICDGSWTIHYFYSFFFNICRIR